MQIVKKINGHHADFKRKINVVIKWAFVGQLCQIVNVA